MFTAVLQSCGPETGEERSLAAGTTTGFSLRLKRIAKPLGRNRRVNQRPEQLFSLLISPEYTIRKTRSFAPKSRASMKIRNQTYAPATHPSHESFAPESQAPRACGRWRAGCC